jgi:hypothetical protein
VRRVVIESPYSGDVAANVAYARACVRDSLRRGEAPIASHLLYTQDGILRDSIPEERSLGMRAGWEWYGCADAIVFYLDRGWSGGMLRGLEIAAEQLQRDLLAPRLVYRSLRRVGGGDTTAEPAGTAAPRRL